MHSYLLEPSDIKKVTGAAFSERGKEYYKNGRVYGLSHNTSINSWRAVVTGTYDYEVRIFFFEDDDLEASCECPAYESYYSCKHIAAVLWAIRGQAIAETSRPTKREETYESRFFTIGKDDFSRRLTETFLQENTTFSNQERTPLDVEYILHMQSKVGKTTFRLEMKFGAKRTYVIKDIGELLEHVVKQREYDITSKFTFLPDEHVLTPEDDEIFKQLHKIAQQEEFYHDPFFHPKRDERYLSIPPADAASLLSRLAERNCTLVDGKHTYQQWEWYGEMPEMNLHVTKEQGTYQLLMSDLKKYQYISNYGLLYRNGQFYHIPEEKVPVYEALLGTLPYRSNGNHTISKEYMETIVSEVVPALSSIADVHYASDVQQDLIQQPLKAQVYLDFHYDMLTADIQFHYGEVTIHPFQPTVINEEKIIQRQSAQEQAIMDVIEQAEFKYDGEVVYLDDEEAIYLFLVQALPELKQVSDVYLSSAVKGMLQFSKTELTPTIDMNAEGSWLDIAFQMDGITEDEISEVMRAIIEKRRYYKLSDGGVLALDSDSFDRFRLLTDEFDLQANDIQDNHIQVSQARSMQVEEALQPGITERSSSYDTLVNRLKEPDTFEVSVPESLDADLREYQLTGFRWLKTLAHYRFGGILADDMGLGKTLQSIAFILSEKEMHNPEHPSLVVAPASLVYNWKKEIERFAPTLTVRVISGDKETREAIWNEDTDADVWITSYPLLRQDNENYKDYKFHALFLDEAQAIKNEATKTAKATRAIQAEHRFALSGTPIENALTELWSIFRTIMPGFYTNKKKFLAMKPEKISRMTRPFILRRLKKDVLGELPDKIETTQYSELTKDQKQVYLAYLEKIQRDVNDTIATKGFQRGKLEILAGLTRLRQICCHPGLFLENYEGESGKLNQLKELALEMKEGGHRMLIFSQFSSMLKVLYEELTKLGIEGFYLDGSTKSEDRIDQVERFNEGEKDVFFISLKAGGTGLNLTGADTVLLYDLWWNPAIEEQAAGRAHRIGQKKVVQVIRMLAEGTIEERIHQLQQKKRDLVDQIIQPGETMLTSLDQEEIKSLLNM
ncbi:DEAD/DEAH box helicase [Thalassobacillus hwangdonensis]|uniref:SNF2 helicase associated domain-containing protein n=1 Tax=Thalassobacillus hwangdonensis TaxID=546108 RepID=A0ABW3L2Q3_9BACI